MNELTHDQMQRIFRALGLTNSMASDAAELVELMNSKTPSDGLFEELLTAAEQMANREYYQ